MGSTELCGLSLSGTQQLSVVCGAAFVVVCLAQLASVSAVCHCCFVTQGVGGAVCMGSTEVCGFSLIGAQQLRVACDVTLVVVCLCLWRPSFLLLCLLSVTVAL
jgi:hypothetical protein